VTINGTAVTATAIGGLLLFSGVAGKSFSGAFRNVLMGQSPQQATSANTILSQIQAQTTSAGLIGSKVGPSISANASQSAWAAAVCTSIAAPPTKANLNSMASWANHEAPWNASPPDGAQYTHNPLNTTDKTGAVGSVNSVGVAVYPNWAVGVAATAATLMNGNYPTILATLRSGKGLCGLVSSEFLTWSGSGYDRVC
jgi:hypothetical protein